MSDQLLLTGHIDAWRCKACEKLIYNVDENGYPAPGAPAPKYYTVTFDQVCFLCFQMAQSADTDYLCRITRERASANKAARERMGL